MKFLAFFCVGILACLEGRVLAVQLVFDNAHDITKVADMTCEYNDDYLDFWVYGCNRSPSEEVFPERTGFWTGCNRNCQLIYHGGLLPKPAKLWIETYIQGDDYIHISGKNSPTDSEEHDFGRINRTETPWCYSEIDLADFSGTDASVINFTISSSTTGFVLIDKIIVDLGDQPIDPITIESKDDELPMHWSYDDCHHLEDYADFWTFGCPVEPVEVNPNSAAGFWSPCIMASCKIEFATSTSLIPSSVTIRGYTEGAAEFKVVASKSKTNPEELTVIETISAKAPGEWVDKVVDLSPYHNYKIGIVLESNGDTVVLDSLSYSFDNVEDGGHKQSEFPKCGQKPATDASTEPTSTTENTGSTTVTTPSTTGATGAGSSIGFSMVHIFVMLWLALV